MFGVEKLRPDWQVKNYVIPISRIETGEDFWNEARILKNAWNDIVAVYRSFDERIKELETALFEAKKEKLDSTDIKADLNQLKKQRKDETLQCWKSQSVNVLNNDWENLQIAVNSAINLAFKNNGTMHFKSGIQSVNFCKRYSGGGVAFSELLTEFDSRDGDLLKRKPVALRVGRRRESNRSRQKTPLHGRMLVGKKRVPINFTGLWSYPEFPEPAFIKKVTLVGKFSKIHHWQWNLIITIEIPPAPVARPDNALTAAIDLGYRRFPDYIRFGLIVDTAGNKFELRLPDGNMLSSYLKGTIKFLADKGIEKKFIRDLSDFFLWDSEQGKCLEEAKAALQTLYTEAKDAKMEMPEAWKNAFNGFAKMKNRGLAKMNRTVTGLLEDENLSTVEMVREILEATTRIIETWKLKDDYFETEKEHFRRKFLGRRKILFRQTVKWLAQNYVNLIWENDLKLGEMATKTKKSSRVTDAALKESNKYRQWTGLYQFREFLKEKNAQSGDWLQPARAAYSTAFCDECGGETISDPAKLILICVNGHERDQDERAARNLLKGVELSINEFPAVYVPPYLNEYIVPLI